MRAFDKFIDVLTLALLIVIGVTGCTVGNEQRSYEWYKAETLDDFRALLARRGEDFQITTVDHPDEEYFEVSFRSTSDHHLCIPYGKWPYESLNDYQRFKFPALEYSMVDAVFVQTETAKHRVRTGHKYCVDTRSYKTDLSNEQLFQCLIRIKPHGQRKALLPYSEFPDLPQFDSPKTLVFDTTAYFCD